MAKGVGIRSKIIKGEKNEMSEIKITRCPSCGGAHLVGVYDKSVGRNTAKKTLLFGLIGAISAIKDAKNNSGAYWQCQDCGCIFPME